MSSTVDADHAGAQAGAHVETSPEARAVIIDVVNAGVIDHDQLDDLHEIFGADALAKLLSRFRDDLRLRLETIDSGWSSADVASNAHAMISAAGSMGFKAFSDLCRSIERLAANEEEFATGIAAFADGANHVLQTIASCAKATES